MSAKTRQRRVHDGEFLAHATPDSAAQRGSLKKPCDLLVFLRAILLRVSSEETPGQQLM